MMTGIPENNCKNEQNKLVFGRQILSRQRSLPASNSKDNHHHHQNQNQNQNHRTLSREELKLAALAISLNARLRSADMPISMMERAFRYARSFLDASAASSTATAAVSHHHRPSLTLLARSIKTEFDSLYGPAWHCVVGKSFGSFVSHSPGGFVYFSVDSFSFLLFKTEVHLVKD